MSQASKVYLPSSSDFRGKPKHRRTRHRRPSNPANCIRYLRTYHGMTQQELSQASDLTVCDLSKMENGFLGSQAWKFIRIVDYFEVSVDALVKDSLAEIVPSLALTPPDHTHRSRSAMAKRQKQFGDVGALGEEIVTELERMKLFGTGLSHGVNANYADDIHAGFDILSFTPQGEVVYIEVKATVGSMRQDFFMSAREKEWMEYCLDNGLNYELHRLYRVKSRTDFQRVIYTGDDLRKLAFTVNDYIVSLED